MYIFFYESNPLLKNCEDFIGPSMHKDVSLMKINNKTTPNSGRGIMNPDGNKSHPRPFLKDQIIGDITKEVITRSCLRNTYAKLVFIS